jgi:hypothetical protein
VVRTPNQHLGRDDSDFLLASEEGFLQRHRSLALTAVVLPVLLQLVVAWELFTVSRKASLAAPTST